jgi:hypothetical protein
MSYKLVDLKKVLLHNKHKQELEIGSIVDGKNLTLTETYVSENKIRFNNSVNKTVELAMIIGYSNEENIITDDKNQKFIWFCEYNSENYRNFKELTLNEFLSKNLYLNGYVKDYINNGETYLIEKI